MFCNILAYLPPLMSLSVENTTWKDACAVTIRIAKRELLWGSGWKWGRQGFIIVLLLQVRNSRHLKINKWASIVFYPFGISAHNRQNFQNNWEELEWIWQTQAICGSQTPRSSQGRVKLLRSAGELRSTRKGGGVTSPGLPLLQLCPPRLFCSSLSLWLWGTGGVNTKAFSFLFWVHCPNSFLLWLPGPGPTCWLIPPGFRQPSFTPQAADFIPPASPNRPPHWRPVREWGQKLAFTLHRVW